MMTRHIRRIHGSGRSPRFGAVLAACIAVGLGCGDRADGEPNPENGAARAGVAVAPDQVDEGGPGPVASGTPAAAVSTADSTDSASPFGTIAEYRSHLEAADPGDRSPVDDEALLRSWSALSRIFAEFRGLAPMRVQAPSRVDDPNLEFEYVMPDPNSGPSSFFTRELANETFVEVGIQPDRAPLPLGVGIRVSEGILGYLGWRHQEKGPALRILRSQDPLSLAAEPSSGTPSDGLIGIVASGARAVAGDVERLELRAEAHPCLHILEAAPWIHLSAGGSSQATIALGPDADGISPPVLVLVMPRTPATSKRQMAKPEATRPDESGLGYLDLDADGVADVAWSRGGLDELFYAVYLNVDGEWEARATGPLYPRMTECGF